MHLEHWASTPLRKLLYDELCFQIGRSVFENDFSKARSMCDVSLKDLQIAEQFIEQFDVSNIDQTKIKQAISYIFENFENNDEDFRRSATHYKDEFEQLDADAYYMHENDTQPSTSKLIGHTWKRATPAEMRSQYCQARYLFLICGDWPKLRDDPKIRMIRYYEEPIAIKTHLSKHKSLNDRPSIVSIAPNTQWSVRNSQQYSKDLEDLCLLIKRRCPSVQINLLGFYTKVGGTLLDNFNSFLKDIERRHSEFVVYVSVDKLLSPSELSSATFKNRNIGLTEFSIVKALKRLATYGIE